MFSAPTFSSRLFSYNTQSRSFVGEISTLVIGNGPLSGQIYPDACDEGLCVVSSKTGRVIRFALQEEKRNADHDLEAIIFKIEPSDARRFGLANDITVHVLID